MAEVASRLTRRRDESARAGSVDAEDRQPTLLTVERALRLLKAIVFEQSLSIREAG